MIIAKKNTAYYLSFPAIDSSTPAQYKTGVSPVDTAYYKDGAGAWTSLSITDTATEIGSTGVYEIDLTAAEMNHDKVFIKFSVSGMADDGYMFDMTTNDIDDLATASNLAIVDGIVDDILADTGTTIPATLSTIDSVVDDILIDTGTTIPSTITTLQSNVTDILTDTGTTLPATLATIDGIVDNILTDTGTTLPATLATIAGYIDTEIGTIITNLATVDTVVDGIQSDLSNGTDGLGALKALIDTLDTVADAIKAKTDSLTFTQAGQVDANTKRIADVTITGDGDATPFDVV